MRIRSLKLERFRGARSLRLDLDERLNVFVGVNGAGKSTILDAAAILLSWFMNRIKQSGASGRPIVEADIANGEASANLEIAMEHSGVSFGWNVARVRRGRERKEVASVLTSASEAANRIRAEISETEGRCNLPLFVYYPVNRAVLDIPLRIRSRHRFDLLSAYDESLTGAANFRTFFEWFREREDLENENRRHRESPAESGESPFPDPQLEAVRRALRSFMPEFANLTVRRSPLRMEVEKNGRRLTVDQLSDGEKGVMALIGDLARRMSIANPLLDEPLEGEGVVLIDEIDLHLHPLWQRMVVSGMTEIFPNCQFLISTHSPHVVTHVRPEHLFLMSMTDEGLEAARAEESYGKTVERVLEDLMGLPTTRPDEVKERILEVYRRIDEGDLDTARESISDLESSIGKDPELLKARVLIRRKELVGK